jgi:hypothetical protein
MYQVKPDSQIAAVHDRLHGVATSLWATPTSASDATRPILAGHRVGMLSRYLPLGGAEFPVDCQREARSRI